MNARAARALRLAAGAQALATVVWVVCYTLNWLWSSAWDRPGISIEALIRRAQIVGGVQTATTIGCAAVTLVAFVLMLSAFERRARQMMAGAIAAVALLLALTVFNLIVPAQMSQTAPYHYPALREALWFVLMIAAFAGPLLALCAAASAAPSGGRGRRATIAYAALGTLPILMKVVSLLLPSVAELGRAFSIIWVLTDLAAIVAFVLAAVWLARAPGQSSRPAAAIAAPAAPGPHDPRSLRLLGWTIIVRVAVGVPLAIIATVGTTRGAADIGMAALVMSTVTGLVVTAMLVTSLAGQRQLPAAICDREALSIAIVLACLAPVFDVWCAVSTGELLSLVGDANRATSLWGMPSISRIEGLQTAATWTGRISLCLGLASSFAVVRSLTATARGLVDEALAARAGRVRALLIYGTGGAITAWIFVTNASLRGDGALTVLVMVGVGLLAIGVWLVVELLLLTFGLASALERPPPAAEFSLPSLT